MSLKHQKTVALVKNKLKWDFGKLRTCLPLLVMRVNTFKTTMITNY